MLQTAEYNQMFSWHLAGKYPEKTVVYHGPYYSPFNRNYNRMCRVFDVLFVGRYRRRGTRFLTKSELARKFLLENTYPDIVDVRSVIVITPRARKILFIV